MKTSNLIMVCALTISFAALTNCNTPAQNVEKAEANVAEANKDLEKASQEYLADIEIYRLETADRIAANEKSIAEFNSRIENKKKDATADYKAKVAELNRKNTDMKKRMNDYKADGKDQWESFKAEFNHDMEELGKSFNDLTVKNVK